MTLKLAPNRKSLRGLAKLKADVRIIKGPTANQREWVKVVRLLIFSFIIMIMEA